MIEALILLGCASAPLFWDFDMRVQFLPTIKPRSQPDRGEDE